MAGTLSEYFKAHGGDGLSALAERCGTKRSYLMQLCYMPHKRPSIGLASTLIKESKGEITLEGLNNPIRMTDLAVCSRCQKVAAA